MAIRRTAGTGCDSLTYTVPIGYHESREAINAEPE